MPASDTTVPPPPIEIRGVRVFVIVALLLATCWAGQEILHVPILTDNKTETGMVLGWLIAKSGTAVDWLFGASEGGSRRADATPVPGGSSGGSGGIIPTGTPGDPVSVETTPGGADLPPVAPAPSQTGG